MKLAIFFICVLHTVTADQLVSNITKSTLKTWTEEIFAGITELPSVTIGQTFAFGPNAFPVLLTDDYKAPVAIAARLGSGRLFITETEYAKSMDQYEYGYCYNDTKYYNGKVSVERKGRVCQDWRVNEPHNNKYTDIKHFPEDRSMEDVANHCRNPSKERLRPWCYTLDPDKRWNYCDVPECPTPEEPTGYTLYQFQNNIKKWLGQGGYNDSTHICYITDASNVSCLEDDQVKVAVVMIKSYTIADSQSDAKMLEWVQNGGGLLYPFSAWLWEQQVEGAPRVYADIPFYNVFIEGGIGIHSDNHKSDLEAFEVDVSDGAVDALFEMNMFEQVHQFRSQDDVGENFTAIVEFMLSIIQDKESFYSFWELQRKMAQHWVPFLTDIEPELPFPDCYSDLPVTPSLQNIYRLFVHVSFLDLYWKTAPYFHLCPGDASQAEQTEATVSFGSVAKRYTIFFSTGYYHVAGEELTVTVLNSSDDNAYKDLYVYSGPHKDELYHKTELRRLPQVSLRTRLLTRVTKMFSPFGGLVIVCLEKRDVDVSFTLHFSKVAKAPSFFLGEKDAVENWPQRRLLPVPWGEIAGNNFTLFLPREALVLVDDPVYVTSFWDLVVKGQYELVGYPPDYTKRQLLCPDVQISAGVLHSGHIIMSNSPKYYRDQIYKHKSDIDQMKYGNMTFWGVYHELGHNVQSKQWTPQYFGEVTNNIFSLFSTEINNHWNIFTAKSRWYFVKLEHKSTYDILINNNEAELWRENNNIARLLIYAQLYRVFGWRCFRDVFRTYQHDRVHDPDSLPQIKKLTPVEHLETYVVRFSNVTRINVCPLFQFWTYQMDCNETKIFPPFLPIDEFTNKTEYLPRTAEIEAMYPDLLRELEEKPACYSPTYLDRQPYVDEIVRQGAEMNEKSLTEKLQHPIVPEVLNPLVDLLSYLRPILSRISSSDDGDDKGTEPGTELSEWDVEAAPETSDESNEISVSSSSADGSDGDTVEQAADQMVGP